MEARRKRVNLYIDVTSVIQQSFITGIQRVVREFCLHLLKQQDEFPFVLVFLYFSPEEKRFVRLDNMKFYEWLVKSVTGNHTTLLSDWKIAPEQLEENSIFLDIDSPWGYEPGRPFFYSLLKEKGLKIVTFIYDVIALVQPWFFAEGFHQSFMAFVDAALAYSDLILVSSETVQKDLMNLAKEMRYPQTQYHIAHFGSDFTLCDQDDVNIHPIAREIANDSPFLYTVSTIEPRKNHKVIMDAYDKYLKDTNVNVVFLGRRGWNTEDLLNRIHSHPDFNRRIFHLEGMNNETVSYLYQKAFLMVFPTYNEGFGLSVVESLLCGTPILLSDTPIMREIGDKNGEYFDPDSPKELADLVLSYLKDKEKYDARKKMIANYEVPKWADFANSIANRLTTI